MPENDDRQGVGESHTERLPQDQNQQDSHTADDWPSAEQAERAVEQTTQFAAVGAEDRTQQVAVNAGAQPESAAERTEQIAAVPADFSNFPITQQTQALPSPVPQARPSGWSGDFGTPPSPAPRPAPARDPKKGLVKAGIIAGAAAGALLLLYLGDLVLTGGTVPRGTVVAGVDIGTLDKAAAESTLREKLEPGLDKPVQVKVGEHNASIDPRRVGLGMDWTATVAAASEQPLNPVTRISSLFNTHEIAPVSQGDRVMLIGTLRELSPQLDADSAEGTIRFDGTKPVAVDPVKGKTLDVVAGTDQVLAHWAEGHPIELPYSETPVTTTHDGVQKALKEIAEPAVSAPVTVRGQGKDAILDPKDIASALRFEPDGQGGLKATLDEPSVVGKLEPQLAETVKPGKDAEVVLEGAAPVVHPSIDGVGIDWPKSLQPALDVLRKPDARALQAVYMPQPAAFTTDQANQLGVKEVVGQFSTGGFEPASGANIRRVAEQVNGALVKPGETFSLNGHTGPRGIPQGYVESGVIENGRPAREVGGGISQFATTLYNASYFAGMQDVEHKAHSYYISRYPAGREATVFQAPNGKSIIDVKFKNVSKSGIMITAQWTPSSITVTLWGTKQFDVGSQTGPHTDPTMPKDVFVPAGEPCSETHGTPGFTVMDTRTIRDLSTGQVRTEDRKTVYNPQPIVHCAAPPPGGAPVAPPPAR